MNVEPIAVVGLACRFPGASDAGQFWRSLVAGRESITFFSPGELAAAGVPTRLANHPDYVAAAPEMPDAQFFDADLFGMTAREAELCDPQIRAFLEVCHTAVEDAGYDPFALPDSVGVFGTIGPNTYLTQHLQRRPDRVGSTASPAVQSMNQPDYLTTTVSYRLNLRGPSMTVLTACSSALAAVHVACQALRYGECDTALAGGAVVDSPSGLGHRWAPGSVYSADGHCRPFSSAASGTVFGSGSGVVALKRLTDAVADGDSIRAVIRGSAMNNDGADKVSFGAPSVSGQAAAIMEAMAIAGVDPREIGFVEAHATGTLLGDPVEIAALNQAHRGLSTTDLPAGSCWIGSVKSNIGHLNEAAGIAGLIKVVLALQHGAIPATIGVGEINERLLLAETPFRIATELQPWPRDEQVPRIAGVTSLGIGGTNVHAVVAEPPVPVHEPLRQGPRLVAWSARNEAALSEGRQRLAAAFGQQDESEFTDAVATLLHGRTEHPVRAAAVVSSAAEAVAVLGSPSAQLISARVDDDPRERGDEVAPVFLFPGQGALRGRMAAGLYGTVRQFTIVIDDVLDRFERLGVPLLDRWLADAPESLLDQAFVQPLLFAIEYALALTWQDWGVAPAALLGHSVGELSAAAVAGVMDLPDAVRAVAARATAMRDHPVRGGMVALNADESTVAELLDDASCRAGGLAVAAVNAACQCVVCGPFAELREFADRAAQRGIAVRELHVSHAFHHPHWTDAVDQFAGELTRVPLRPPEIPLYSGRTGSRVTDAEAVDPAFWCGQIAAPVRFGAAVEAVLADGHRLLLEVGLGRTLSQLAPRTTASGAGTITVPGLPARGDEPVALLESAARLWVNGCRINWTAADHPPPRTRVALPSYPYQRTRHWIDAPATTPAADHSVTSEPAATDGPADAAPKVAAEPASPFSVVVWERIADRNPIPPSPTGTAVVFLPADPEAADLVLRAVQRSGHRVVRARPGKEYAETGSEFRIGSAGQPDIEAMFTALAARGQEPTLVMHASGLAPWPTAADVSAAADRTGDYYASVRAFVRTALLAVPARAPRVVVLTRHAVDVTGSELIEPGKATALGLVRSVLAEAPHLRGGVLDLGDRVDLAQVAAELARPESIGVVALRGPQRWLGHEHPLAPPPGTGARLRERGVYLITGGLGGLGLALAEGIAATGLCPKLLLLGRSDPEHGERVASVGARLAELHALGATVEVIRCDVSQETALRSAINAAISRHGMVNGVFHLAGVAGGGMVAFGSAEDTASVLAPKVRGTLALDAVFAGGTPLDFTVYYSSRAAADGLVGAADYAAANAYLDATAARARQTGARVLSVGWPVWTGAGMAHEAGVDVAGLSRTVRQLSAGAAVGSGARQRGAAGSDWWRAASSVATEVELSAAEHWVLDEHRVNRIPLLPGTAYLDLVVRSFRAGVDPSGAGPVVLTDVVFRAPLHDSRPHTVRLSYRLVPGDACGTRQFAVSSRPAMEGAGDWTLHVTGRVVRGEAGSVAPSVDLDEVRARLTAAGGRGREQAGSAFTLGPRWRTHQEQWSVGAETLVRLELARAFHDDLAEYAMHPALLDVATAAVRGAGQASTIPFCYRRLVVHGDLGSQLYAHVRRDDTSDEIAKGDIDVAAPDGTVIVRIEGFTMRRIELDRLGTSTTENPVAASSNGDHLPGPPRSGLPVETGVTLLLDLLRAETYGPVLVRPFSDEQPVPIPGTRVDTVEATLTPEGRPGPLVVTADVRPVPPSFPAGEASDDGDPVAAALRRIWADVLGVDQVGDDEDFFDAGGSSLAAIDILARVRESLGVELSIGLLLDHRTLRELLGALRAELAG